MSNMFTTQTVALRWGRVLGVAHFVSQQHPRGTACVFKRQARFKAFKNNVHPDTETAGLAKSWIIK